MFTEEIGGRICTVDRLGTEGPVVWWGVHGQEAPAEMMKTVRKKAQGRGAVLIAYPVEDWNRDFSPWQAPAAGRGEAFAGGGKETLCWLAEKAVPQAEALYFRGQRQEHFLAGYSLAGLFSLWALYESPRFAGAACCSGSLWYPGWEKYTADHRIQEGSRIYLSLGTKEEKTRNPVMARVGDAVREQYRRMSLDTNVRGCVLEWNPGGHFSDPEGRVARGVLWLLRERGGGI